jgi:ribA/ribD-fused uncharacterized protein
MSIIAIRKVDEPYGWLGNMSPHPVYFEGTLFKTSEHLFQWGRFRGYPEIQKDLIAQPSPMGLKMKVKKYRKAMEAEGTWVYDEAKDIQWMRECLRLKIRRYADLMRKLKASHPHRIVEDCSNRKGGSGMFWGAALIDGEWVGRNVLGELWMEIREELLREEGGSEGQLS